MPCDHALVEQHLFDYLDSAVEPSVARAIEKSIDDCEHCRDLYQSAVSTQQMQARWQEQPVPDWHRTNFAVPKRSRNTWTWPNRLSLATSMLALFMVIFRVEFIAGPAGFSVSFGGKGSETQVEHLVAEKVSELAQQQVRYIDNRFTEYNLKQVDNTQQMLTAVMQHNRQERRQDLNAIMASWLEQRDIDQLKLNQRVDYLLDNQIENSQALNHVLKVSSQEQY